METANHVVSQETPFAEQGEGSGGESSYLSPRVSLETGGAQRLDKLMEDDQGFSKTLDLLD